MEVVMMLMKNSTKKMEWDNIKKEMLNISFRNDIFRYDPLTMGEKVFKTVKKEYIKKSTLR